MKLIIIRHGEPDYSIDSLTKRGFREAELLSERLCKMDIKAFYVSPLGRAKDTAAPTLRKMGRDAVILDWLKEFSPKVKKPWKESEGCAWDWLPKVWTKEPRFYDKNAWSEPSAFADAEVGKEYDRVCAGLDALLREYGYERNDGYYKAVTPNHYTIVLFCHFGLKCVLLSHLLGVSPMVLWHGACAAPSSVTILNTEERRQGIAYFRMSTFGDTSHLYAAGDEASFAARFCETYTDFEQRHD